MICCILATIGTVFVLLCLLALAQITLDDEMKWRKK